MIECSDAAVDVLKQFVSYDWPTAFVNRFDSSKASDLELRTEDDLKAGSVVLEVIEPPFRA